MVNTQFFQFAKRKNSTARPGGTPGAAFNCNIKESSSVLRPTLQISTAGISGGGAGFPTHFNYAYIATFNRYYYVVEWVSIAHELWEVILEVDVLATYRVEIGNATAYVARASEDYDGTISDGLFPTTSKVTCVRNYWYASGTQHSPWLREYADGTYILGIVNSEGSGVGGITYYAMSNSGFNAFKGYLLGDYEWTGIEDTNPDLGENLYKSLFNPFQYISSITWFPIGYSSISGTPSTLKLGWWVLSDNITCKVLSGDTAGKYLAYDVIYTGVHPETDERGIYVCSAPYSQYRLYAPPFGEFTLDAQQIASSVVQFDSALSSALTIIINVDLISGMGQLEVLCTSGVLVRASAMVGVNIAIAQINSNGWGQVRNIAETSGGVLGSLFSGNIGGAISSAATGILNGIELSIPHSQEKGSNGSIGEYQRDFFLECVYSDLADDALEDKGRPLCKEVVLSTLAGGYVQTVGAHVDIAAYLDEVEQINTLLDGGIYLILAAG